MTAWQVLEEPFDFIRLTEYREKNAASEIDLSQARSYQSRP